MEDGSCNQRVEKSNDGIICIPERSNADLADQDNSNRNQGAQESSSPDGDDFVAHWVGELRIDDLAILEADGEGSGCGGVGFVDLGEILDGFKVQSPKD